MSTILTGVSDLKGFLAGWSIAGSPWEGGAFWSPATGLVTDDLSGDYEQWGDGVAGGKGVLLEGNDSFHYDKDARNISGDVSALTFGDNFSASGDGIGLVAQLALTLDQDFDYSQSKNLFDYAIHEIYANNSLSGLYDYLAETGTVIFDTGDDDILIGFDGEDRFVFSKGHDVVAGDDPDRGLYGYQDEKDTLDVSDWGVVSFDQLTVTGSGNDTLITYNDDDAVSIQLIGVDASVIDASDFIFASSLGI